jgi:hypothetical protein
VLVQHITDANLDPAKVCRDRPIDLVRQCQKEFVRELGPVRE